MHGRLKLAVMCFALTCLVVNVSGLTTWQEFLQRTPELFKAWVNNRSFNFTVPSFVLNLGFAVVEFETSSEMAQLLWKVAITSGLAILAISYAMCWYTRRNENEGYLEKEFALLCTAMLAGSLIAWGHYLVFLIFPFIVAVVQVSARPSGLQVLGIVSIWLALNCLGTLENAFLNKHLIFKVLINYIPLLGIIGLGFFLVKGLRQSE
jgi:hypothetical protein